LAFVVGNLLGHDYIARTHVHTIVPVTVFELTWPLQRASPDNVSPIVVGSTRNVALSLSQTTECSSQGSERFYVVLCASSAQCGRVGKRSKLSGKIPACVLPLLQRLPPPPPLLLLLLLPSQLRLTGGRGKSCGRRVAMRLWSSGQHVFCCCIHLLQPLPPPLSKLRLTAGKRETRCDGIIFVGTRRDRFVSGQKWRRRPRRLR
jgi:hypothetical protein